MRSIIATPSALIALAGLALLGAGCQQPLVNCAAAHSPYAAAFKLTKGDAQTPCGSLAGDVVSINTYFQEGGLNGTPDYDNAKIAITSAHLAGPLDLAESWTPSITDPNPDHTRNAIGAFTTGKPVDEFCVVDEFDPAIVELPELPAIPAVPDDPMTEEDESVEEVPAVPPQSHRFDWSDFRVLVTADAQGTQFSAHLKYTQDGCVAEYDVLAVAPAVSCADDEGNPDQSLCDDPASGLNPDFATECDPALLLCVITSEPPVYRE